MSTHISDDLPRLLSGEAGRDETLAAATHLRDCADCQQELVSALVAHASLTSAHRFAPEIVAGLTATNFDQPDEDPSADVVAIGSARSAAPSDAVTAQPSPGRHTAPESDDDADDPTGPGALPDLSAVFAQIRSEIDDPAGPPADDLSRARARKGSRTKMLLAAAAAVVVVGGGGGALYALNSSDSAPAGRTVALSAYDLGTHNATARIDGQSISINATSLPKLVGKRYEVWLTSNDRTSLQPIGWISSDGTANLHVPDGLLSKLPDLEVSVQNLDKGYAFSHKSVLRGSTV